MGGRLEPTRSTTTWPFESLEVVDRTPYARLKILATLTFLRPTLLPRELLSLPLRISLPRPSFRRHLTTAPPAFPKKPPFSFLVGTSFHGKPVSPEEPDSPDQRRRRPKKLLQGFAADSPIALWRDEQLREAPWGAGHDWFFVEKHVGEEGVVLGIADGVGGWEDSGVDPSHFSQALMYYCAQAVRGSKAGEAGPRDLLEEGFVGVTGEKGVLAGSSTACIVTLDARTGLLRAANLGDSTFLLIRSSKVIHAQKAQTHYFNAPRQLSKLPKGSSTDGAFMDFPKHADLYQTSLQDGDILLLTTDGFSDNVWPRELEQLLSLVISDNKSSSSTDVELVQKIAAACCNFARICSFKENKESPFEAEARTHGLDYRGGKVDDVCVVAVLVVKP